jgi:hypothetical protein
MVKVLSKLIASDESITVVADVDGLTRVILVRKDHPRYGLVKQAYLDKDWETFVEYYDGSATPQFKEVQKANIPDLELKDGVVTYKGRELTGAIVDVIRQHVRDGVDTGPIMKFLARLMNNPSKRSLDQLYTFIEKNGLSIDEDGFILCYKVVRHNYLDKHSGKFDNSPGNEISCNRNEVDDNPNNTCSKGFHLGGFDYSGPNGYFYAAGDKIVICKVDPADVVSIPVDANAGKMRCCRYVVLADYVHKLPSGLSTAEGLPEELHPKTMVESEGPKLDDEEDDSLFEDDEYDWDDGEDDSFDDDELVELEPGDVVTFTYHGELRKVEVESNGAVLLKGRLLKGDPSYVVGETRYRNFKHAEVDDFTIV